MRTARPLSCVPSSRARTRSVTSYSLAPTPFESPVLEQGLRRPPPCLDVLEPALQKSAQGLLFERDLPSAASLTNRAAACWAARRPPRTVVRTHWSASWPGHDRATPAPAERLVRCHFGSPERDSASRMRTGYGQAGPSKRESPAGEVRERPNRTHCQPEQASRYRHKHAAKTVLIWRYLQCAYTIWVVLAEFMDRIMDNRLGQWTP